MDRFSAQFVAKKIKKTRQSEYDTIRIVEAPEGATKRKSRESSVIKKILAKQNESNFYKVYVGISYGVKALSVGYIDSHNKKRWNSILKRYPAVAMDTDHELKGIGSEAIDGMDKISEINGNDREDGYIFDNFMQLLCNNKLVEIENEFADGDNGDIGDDHKEREQIDVVDKKGHSVNVSLLFDVTLQFLWDCALSVIKKTYSERWKEDIEETQIEWKVAIPDMIYAVCKPMILQSAGKLGLSGNITVIRESVAIAMNYNVKLRSSVANVHDAKFMAIMLDAECSKIGVFKIRNEYQMKELVEPIVLKNVSLKLMIKQFLAVFSEVIGENEFEGLIGSDPRKMDEIKLRVVEVMKGANEPNVRNDSNPSNDMVFDNILGTTLDPIFKEMDRLLAMKQVEGSKQHIIISGEMAEIEWVQNMIRRRFREQKHLKVKEESIHFAKSKRAKGAALFDIITPKNQTLAYRANKSWGISVQRDFIPELDDRNKRIKGTENGQWVVNGVFHEIIRMGEMVRANHCEVVWVQPIHDRKIQIDVYSNDSLAVHQGDGGVLYIEDCQYEGYVHVFVFDDIF